MRISEDKLEDSDKGKIEAAIQETLVWLEATIGMILFRRQGFFTVQDSLLVDMTHCPWVWRSVVS